jgi:hypothetical protein
MGTLLGQEAVALQEVGTRLLIAEMNRMEWCETTLTSDLNNTAACLHRRALRMLPEVVEEAIVGEVESVEVEVGSEEDVLAPMEVDKWMCRTLKTLALTMWTFLPDTSKRWFSLVTLPLSGSNHSGLRFLTALLPLVL